MSVKWLSAAAAVALLVCSAYSAPAATLMPLRLDYSVTAQGGGAYLYDFDLILDNNDGSFVVGNQWDWITFGDRATENTPSLLCNSCPVEANFTAITPGLAIVLSSGGHNGPTLAVGANGVVLPGWQPTAVGQRLEWTFVAPVLLPQGQLLWSTLVHSTGARPANFNVANLVAANAVTVPEPATWAMMIGGFGLAGAVLRRRRAVA